MISASSRQSFVYLAMLIGLSGGCTTDASSPGEHLDASLEFEAPAMEPGSLGELVVSHFGAEAEPPDRMASHRTTFMPGQSGVAMEDNDLRGFLDGTFQWGWNQPGQYHVRFGRRSTNPEYGEHEVFRVIQLWEGVRLPPSALVRRAELVLRVEEGPEHPVQVMLYRVNRGWNPGEGGTQKDNVSPPAPGEVWWNSPGFGEGPWGLPGLGYAGPGPDADTPETALADAVYEPGDSLLRFSDPALASYVQERATSAESLRFLLKTSDVEEDRPGSLVTVYSANYGGSPNTARRPTLELDWSNATGRTLYRESILLEHARGTVAGPFSIPASGWVNVGFSVADGYHSPLLEIRGGATFADTADWSAVVHPVPNSWSWLEVRVRALHDPIEFGLPFEFEIHETWVLPEPSETRVRVAFLAPSGRRRVVSARYTGPYTWAVRFIPDEVGSWRYRWIGEFAESPMLSPVGRFDVVVTSHAQVEAALGELIRDLEARDPDHEHMAPERDVLYKRFLRLERAVLRLETPESFHADSNRTLPLVRRARELLHGAPLPDSIPFLVSPSHRGRTEHESG